MNVPVGKAWLELNVPVGKNSLVTNVPDAKVLFSVKVPEMKVALTFLSNGAAFDRTARMATADKQAKRRVGVIVREESELGRRGGAVYCDSDPPERNVHWTL